MKFRRILPLLMTGLLTVSCQQQTYVGDYGFSMGKETGTHFGINFSLRDKDVYNTEGTTLLGKEFALTLNMLNGNQEEQAFGFLSDLGDIFGYYKVAEKLEDDKNRLLLGIDLMQNEEFKTSYDDMKEANPELEDLIIPPDLVEKIIYATISDSAVNLNVPVSINDLIFQLYWYGYDLSIDSLLATILNSLSDEDEEEIKTDGEEARIISRKEESQEEQQETEEVYTEVVEHPAGTHPTAEDIEEINKTYVETHGKKYRDFHTLALGLLKK